MNSNNQFAREWSIGGIKLNLVLKDGVWELEQQTPQYNLLTSLSVLKSPQVATCALDIIFQQGFTSDTTDALRAYSANPLSDPPDQYLKMCYSVDWNIGYQTKQLYAIILSGLNDSLNRNLLITILDNAKPDMRDAPLYAASSFDDLEIVEKVIGLCAGPMSDVLETGEFDCFRSCFWRWLNRGTLSMQSLNNKIARHQGDSGANFKRLMNAIVCKRVEDIPFPEIIGKNLR